MDLSQSVLSLFLTQCLYASILIGLVVALLDSWIDPLVDILSATTGFSASWCLLRDLPLCLCT
jgi:hypothetical protein